MSLDMRFASPNAVFGNLEVAVGLHPGSGGVVYMSELIGRARAFEFLLSGNDIDAKTAEQVGLVNKAFPSLEELDAFVSQLSSRISLPNGCALQHQDVDQQSDESTSRPISFRIF